GEVDCELQRGLDEVGQRSETEIRLSLRRAEPATAPLELLPLPMRDRRERRTGRRIPDVGPERQGDRGKKGRPGEAEQRYLAVIVPDIGSDGDEPVVMFETHVDGQRRDLDVTGIEVDEHSAPEGVEQRAPNLSAVVPEEVRRLDCLTDGGC